MHSHACIHKRAHMHIHIHTLYTHTYAHKRIFKYESAFLCISESVSRTCALVHDQVQTAAVYKHPWACLQVQLDINKNFWTSYQTLFQKKFSLYSKTAPYDKYAFKNRLSWATINELMQDMAQQARKPNLIIYDVKWYSLAFRQYSPFCGTADVLIVGNICVFEQFHLQTYLLPRNWPNPVSWGNQKLGQANLTRVGSVR